jgi:hypothetical protein
MPVHVTVALLASETQHIEALGRNYALECRAGTMYHGLEAEVLRGVEVPDDAFAVLDRCDHEVSTHDRVLAEVHDRVFVAVRDVMEELGISSQ